MVPLDEDINPSDPLFNPEEETSKAGAEAEDVRDHSYCDKIYLNIDSNELSFRLPDRRRKENKPRNDCADQRPPIRGQTLTRDSPPLRRQSLTRTRYPRGEKHLVMKSLSMSGLCHSKRLWRYAVQSIDVGESFMTLICRIYACQNPLTRLKQLRRRLLRCAF